MMRRALSSAAALAAKGAESKATVIQGAGHDPVHGSYHWTYERLLSIATLGATAAAFAVPQPAPLLDLALGVVVPLHCHVGFGAIVTDYVPRRKFPRLYPLARGALAAGTAGALYGLYLFNTREVGIVSAVRAVLHPRNDA